MSKILKISKHKLDLAKIELTGPSLIIGRSPLCDQVLRVPGIKPVHFLLEWVGEGFFNPNEGAWTLFDMSHLVSNLDSTEVKNDLAAEGIIIDKNQKLLGLNWSIVEDRIVSSNIQRGVISKELDASVKKRTEKKTGNQAIEIVSLSKKEQNVKEIWYFFDEKISGPNLSKLPLDLKWYKKDELHIHFRRKPDVIFSLKGERIDANQSLILTPNETIILHFSDEIFFIRFTSRVVYQASKFNFSQDNFWIWGAASFFLCFLILWQIHNSQNAMEESKPLHEMRLVKILEKEPPVEVKVGPEPEKVVTSKVPLPSDAPLQNKVEEIPKTSPLKLSSSTKKESTAAAPSYKSEAGKERLGLNSPAKVSDVNSVGLLGAIKSKGASGRAKQISAETITQTFVDNTASSSTDKKGTLIRTAEMGVIGTPDQNSGGGSDGQGNENGLIEAQTSLRGAGDFNAASSGPIARLGGLEGTRTIGLGRGKVATSGGHSGPVSPISSDGVEVLGGLTKAQVYAVINAHRREIRTCFESALLVRNDLNGILRLKFFINVAGAVTEINIVNSDLNSTILESCVSQVIRQMVFPEAKNQQPTTVIYPFVFKRTS